MVDLRRRSDEVSFGFADFTAGNGAVRVAQSVAVAETAGGQDGQDAVIPALPADARAGDTVALTMRPEAVSLANGHARDIVLDGTVAEVNFLGSVIRLKVALGGDNAIHIDTFNDQRTPPPVRDQHVRITLAGEDVLVLGD